MAQKAGNFKYAAFISYASSDPANAGWQRDVFVSYFKLSEVATQQGDQDAAREYFTTAKGIIEPLAKKDSSNRTWQNDLAWVDEQLSNLGAE